MPNASAARSEQRHVSPWDWMSERGHCNGRKCNCQRDMSILGSPATYGIHASKVVLFGSFATGRADEDSDIDLIVIAPEFDGPREIETVKDLWHATLLADDRIEPIRCGEREWEPDTGRLIIEIARREGVIIEAEHHGPAANFSDLTSPE